MGEIKGSRLKSANKVYWPMCSSLQYSFLVALHARAHASLSAEPR